MEEKLMGDRRFLVSAVADGMANLIAQQIPDSGVFQSRSFALVYPGTKHKGRIYVQHSAEHGCCIRISMIVEGTSMEISNYMVWGSKANCIAWLRDESHVEELLAAYNHLTEKADEKSCG